MPGAQMNNVVQNKVLFGRRFKQHNMGLFTQRALTAEQFVSTFPQTQYHKGKSDS